MSIKAMEERTAGFVVSHLFYEEGELVECASCGWWSYIEDSEIIADCYLDVGSEVPAGRCPECGALCYLVDNAGMEELARRRELIRLDRDYNKEGLDV